MNTVHQSDYKAERLSKQGNGSISCLSQPEASHTPVLSALRVCVAVTVTIMTI